MLELNLCIEAHDGEHDLHYLAKLPSTLEIYIYNPEFVTYHLESINAQLIAKYRQDMVKNKFHLKIVK